MLHAGQSCLVVLLVDHRGPACKLSSFGASKADICGAQEAPCAMMLLVPFTIAGTWWERLEEICLSAALMHLLAGLLCPADASTCCRGKHNTQLPVSLSILSVALA